MKKLFCLLAPLFSPFTFAQTTYLTAAHQKEVLEAWKSHKPS